MNPRQASQGPALLAAALLILAWEALGGDLWVAHRLGGAAGFPWRHHWLTETVLHEGGRALSGVALVLWAAWAMGPQTEGRPSRRERWRAWVLSLGLLLLVPAIKRLSLASCPWDMHDFGGAARYVSHWLSWWPAQGDGGPGHCFPAGHATAAFAFLPGVWMWAAHDRRMAMRWALAVVSAGVLLSLGQTLRGAHFVSHHLWTAWLCWACSAMLAPRRLARAPAVIRDAQSLDACTHLTSLAGAAAQPWQQQEARTDPGLRRWRHQCRWLFGRASIHLAHDRHRLGDRR